MRANSLKFDKPGGAPTCPEVGERFYLRSNPDTIYMLMQVDASPGAERFQLIDLEDGRPWCISPALSVIEAFNGMGAWGRYEGDVTIEGSGQ